MSFSNLYENKILDLFFNGKGFSIAPLYMGLALNVNDTHTAADVPEPSPITSPDYARVEVFPAIWNTANAGVMTNKLAITFAEALTIWGEVSHWILITSATIGLGHLFVYGLLQETLDIGIGSIPHFNVSDITITLD